MGRVAFRAICAALVLAALVFTPAAEAQTPADPADWGQPPGSVEDVAKRGIGVKQFTRPDGKKATIFGARLHWLDSAGKFREFRPKLREVGAEILSSTGVCSENGTTECNTDADCTGTCDGGVPFRFRVVASQAGTECLPAGGVKGCVILQTADAARGLVWKLTTKPVFVDSTHVEFTKGFLTCQYTLGRLGAALRCAIGSNVGSFTHTWDYALLGGEPAPTLGPDGSVVLSFASIPPLTARGDAGNSVSVPWSLGSGQISATLDDSTLTAPYVIE